MNLWKLFYIKRMQIKNFQNCGAYWLLFKLVWAKNLQLASAFSDESTLRSSKISSMKCASIKPKYFKDVNSTIRSEID